MRRRWRLTVYGIVQGVGFRPWVHSLATGCGLGGFVSNSGAGVTLEVEGDADRYAEFRRLFGTNVPPLAAIDEVREVEVEPTGDTTVFEIRDSATRSDGEFVLVPPDIATCDACLRELRDPADRRYAYPFINCTHCGPRYTIIENVPYDRPYTTMSEFAMCDACAAEYRDPADRRFHAQPVACPQCGPWVELWDHNGKLCERAEAIAGTKRLLAQGHVVAIKGLGGFHLACMASSADAVRRLREGKRRSDKPFAVMARDLDVAGRLATELSDADRQALMSPRRPIVLVLRGCDAAVCADVAPGLDWLGLMLPYTPLHHLLFSEEAPYDALVMTSGNLSEEPIASRNDEVAPRLHGLAEYFLTHNRRIHVPADDSVVRTFEGRDRVIRRSRGYAPHPIDLGVPARQILACGGELKNTFCLTREHYAILSQHIGDLENLETLQVFERTIEHMRRFFRIDPECIAHDLHPQYLSTQYASRTLDLPKIAVQHHHAHVAACMAENRLPHDARVTGVALDGTGYGTDGRIWGGEFLECGYADFTRRLHFRYVPLAGGDAAVKQTWRAGLAYARDAGIEAAAIESGVSPQARKIVEQMIDKRVNAIDTSSCGRLFDAVAAILGVRLEASYEGQAAMELEALALRHPSNDPYPFHIADTGEIDFRDMIRALANEDPATAAGRFHETIARVIVDACRVIGNEDVCLSGGVFQNFTLLRRAKELLTGAGFRVWIHALVPPNDGGLCLGQAAVANAIIMNR